ncbi:hypothetical protein G7046_g9090 [Stylonectria norvegica]|nr:hypothetical protein G7046_g9090 [Stylonectria norvegica]
MPEFHRSIETSRLEIVIIAAGVGVLVCVLGIIILTGIGLKSPTSKNDTENCQRTTAWGGSWEEKSTRQPAEAYHDKDETFISSVRRRSQSLADELRQELNYLTRSLTASSISTAERRTSDQGLAHKRRTSSLEYAVLSPRKASEPDLICEMGGESLLDSPISATGREDDPKTSRKRRSSRTAKAVTSYDLEAQNNNEPL